MDKKEKKPIKNVHEGHRSRMRKDFKQRGFDEWHEHQVLEYILHSCLPRVDTNKIAHELIDECGGFANVFRMTEKKLKAVYGVGDNAAGYLHMLGEFVRYYNGKRYEANRLVLDSDSCSEYMLNLFDGKVREYFYLICLDVADRIVSKTIISEGSFESLDIDIGKLVRFVMQSDSERVVLAHNHPSGILKASDADIVATQTINRVFQTCGLKLIDHIIVAGGECMSMRAENLIESKRRIL